MIKYCPKSGEACSVPEMCTGFYCYQKVQPPVPDPENPPPDRLVVANGRLKRKIAKLLAKIDHLNEKIETYDRFMAQYAYFKSSFETYAEKMQERLRVRALEERVKQQDLIIAKLLKDEK